MVNQGLPQDGGGDHAAKNESDNKDQNQTSPQFKRVKRIRSRMETACYAAAAIATIVGVLAALFAFFSHYRDLVIWSSCLTIILYVISFFCWFQDREWKRAEANVSAPIVSPDSVTLHTGQYAQHTLVDVRNPNDFPVYSVALQLLPKGVPAESVGVEMDKPDPLLQIAVDESVNASQDTIRTDGASNGFEAVILRMHVIPPNASKRFRVFGTKPIKSSADLSVQSWQQTPEPMISGPLGTGTVFHNSNNIVIRRIGILMSPATNQIKFMVGDAPTIVTVGDGRRQRNATGLVFYQDGPTNGIDGRVAFAMDGWIYLGWPSEFVRMKSGEFAFNSPPYHQHQNESGVDIVNSKGQVVYQSVQKPGYNQIYGMFPVSNGVWVADVDGNRLVVLEKRNELTGLKVQPAIPHTNQPPAKP